MKFPLTLTCLLLVRALRALSLRSTLTSTVERNGLETELLISVSEADTMINFDNEVIIKSGPYPLGSETLNLLACADVKNIKGNSFLDQIMQVFTLDDIDIDMKVLTQAFILFQSFFEAIK